MTTSYSNIEIVISVSGACAKMLYLWRVCRVRAFTTYPALSLYIAVMLLLELIGEGIAHTSPSGYCYFVFYYFYIFVLAICELVVFREMCILSLLGLNKRIAQNVRWLVYAMSVASLLPCWWLEKGLFLKYTTTQSSILFRLTMLYEIDRTMSYALLFVMVYVFRTWSDNRNLLVPLVISAYFGLVTAADIAQGIADATGNTAGWFMRLELIRSGTSVIWILCIAWAVGQSSLSCELITPCTSQRIRRLLHLSVGIR